jgi:PKD repeat protein
MKLILQKWSLSMFLLISLVLSSSVYAQTVLFEPNRVNTYSGLSAGYANGTAASALYNLPTGIAADTFGNIYIADYSNNRIRKINSAGIVTNFAGNGTYNFANGLDTNAKFRSPSSVACDLAGNVYVADQYNNRIRKITPAGLVSTYAGSGVIGTTDGLADSARFNFPTGVACDMVGNVYVADQYNHKIRKISPAGIVSTFCGVGIAGFLNGADSVARFSLPTGLACDMSGNVYVADYINNVIRKITPSGIATTYAGTGTSGYQDGLASSSMFVNPTGVFFDTNGDLFVCDKGNQKLRRVSLNGNVVTYAGSFWGVADGSGTAAQFANPYNVIRARNGSLYLADANNNRIRKMELATLSPFFTDTKTPSVSQVITVSGRSLTGNLIVKAPTGFQVSLLSGNGFVDSLILVPTAGELLVDVYVRLNSSIAGNYNALIELKSNAATTQTFALTGTISCVSNSGISPSGISNANYQQYFSQQFSQTGYVNPRWSISSGTLPTGVTIDSITGLLGGSPNQVGFFTFTIKVNEGVCFQTLVYSIQVNGTPLSRFNYVPNSCSNRGVLFSDSSILDTSWNWSFGDGSFSTLQNPFHVFAKDSIYEVKLTINGSNGPISTRFVQIATTPPTPTLSQVASCSFEYSFLGAPSGYDYRYLWGFDPGSTGNGDTIQFPKRSYSFSGSTTVALTVSAQGKCFAIANNLVFNASLKKIGVTSGLNLTAPSGNACSNNRILTNTSTGSGSVFTYSIDGSAFLPIITTANLNGLSVGSHMVRLAAHDTSCFDTVTQSFIISGATASFSSTPSTCNQEVSFTNTSSVGFGSASYFWVFGSPSKGTSTQMNPKFNFGVPGNDSTSLTVTSESGCTQSLKLRILVGSNIGPTPNFTFSQVPNVCTNKAVFTNTTLNGTGASYLWHFGDSTFSSSLNTSRGYADTGYFNVTLTVTTSTCSLSTSKVVYIPWNSFGPSAKFSVNNSNQPVSNHSFNFVNQSTHLGSGFNNKYYWDFGDGNIDSTNNSAYNKKYASAGIYNVTLFAKSFQGCFDQYTQKVNVYQVEMAKFGYVPNTCTNRMVAFRDSSTLATSYHWDFGDGDTSNIPNPSHLYLRDSIYTVRLVINGSLLYSMDVTVATTPVGGPITSSSNCDNLYTFSGAPVRNGLSYLWNFDGGIGGNQAAIMPSCTYASAGSKNVSVLVSSYGRCPNLMTLSFAAASPATANFAKLSLTSPTGDLCSNSRVLNNLSNPGSTYTYSLDTSSYLPFGTPSLLLQNLSTGYHVIRLRATQGTCVSTAVKEFFISTATANFAFTPSNCNQVVTFQNLSGTSDNVGYTSRWIFGTPAKDTSYDYSPSYDYKLAGTDSATLMITSSSGCTSTIRRGVTIGSGTTTLNAGFSSALVPGACENKYKFTDTTTGGSNLSYNWDFGDGTSSSERNPVKSFGTQGNFTVTLTSSLGGCFSTAAQQVNIASTVYGPAASFKVSNNIQNLAGNSFNYINDTKYLGPGWVLKYYWKLGDGQIDSINNSIFTKVYNYADTFEVKLIVLSSTGCVDSTSQKVIVVPVPISNFGVNLNTCDNRTVSFIDSTTMANTYLWEFGDGDTSTLSEPIHSYDADGEYMVSLTINGNLRTSKTISIASYPKATYTYSANNCSNRFQFMGTDTSSLYTYLWRFSAGKINDSLVNNPEVDFSADGKVYFDYRVVSGGKCISQSPLDSINTFMGVKAAALVTSSNLCGSDRVITNNSVGGNSFQLSLDGTPYSTYTGPASYSNLGSGDHQLRFVASDGTCSDTTIQFFKVSALTGGFTSRSSNCDQSVEFFSNVVSADASSISYAWDFAGEGVSNQATPIFVFGTQGKKKVSLQASSESGCVINLSDSVVANSSVGPISTFTITEIKTTPCQSGFNFASTSPNAIQFYWNYGDGQVSDQGTSTTSFHAYLDTGWYSTVMVAINSLGCSTVSDTINLYVTTASKPSPIASFLVNDTVNCISYQNFNFINASSLKGAGWISKFTWSLSDGTFDTISNSIYGKKFASLGTFTISLTATTNLGCSNTSIRTVRVVPDSLCVPIVIGVESWTKDANIHLYPNPNHGAFTLQFEQVMKQDLSMRIIDVLGREVYSNILPANKQSHAVEVPEASGNYYIELSNSAGEKVRKSFVIVH